MKPKILTLIAILMVVICCQKDDHKMDSTNEIIGKWIYEYELKSDGTKDFDNPYALLEFEYSDGFILNEEGTGSSVWYDSINGNFEWLSDNRNSKLIISVIRTDNSIDEFEYSMSILDENSMEFETPKGHIYRMNKK